MTVRAFTFSMFHGKGEAGSTRLQIHQLMPHWPELGLYKYGENPDVMIFQKVYMQPDWRFIDNFEGIKILYICDPDWLDNVEVKKTLDAVDGAVCPTEAMAEFLRQLTHKPIKVIPDRHELTAFPLQAKHTGPLESVVWFGYKHNALSLRWVMNYIARHKTRLTVISNEDPMPYQWAENEELSKSLYSYLAFDHETLNQELAKHDAALLPISNRPVDRFKSNNRTVIAWLSGLPVITDDETFKRYQDPANRKLDSEANLSQAIRDYDIRQSVKELKAFIEELYGNRKAA